MLLINLWSMSVNYQYDLINETLHSSLYFNSNECDEIFLAFNNDAGLDEYLVEIRVENQFGTQVKSGQRYDVHGFSADILKWLHDAVFRDSCSERDLKFFLEIIQKKGQFSASLQGFLSELVYGWYRKFDKTTMLDWANSPNRSWDFFFKDQKIEIKSGFRSLNMEVFLSLQQLDLLEESLSLNYVNLGLGNSKVGLSELESKFDFLSENDFYARRMRLVKKMYPNNDIFFDIYQFTGRTKLLSSRPEELIAGKFKFRFSQEKWSAI